jgi:(E)-4-hydroxy-3-methylbut-2-enyl-diphosphate synthase
MNREQTRAVKVGSVTLGGLAPVTVQTMWDRPLGRITGLLSEELRQLQQDGCDIIRFSVPSAEDAQKVGEIAALKIMPVVADIHFDYKLAVLSAEAGADKIRINPGNIGAGWKVDEVIRAAADHGCAVRIGLNGGSLPKPYSTMPDRAEALSTLAGEYINLFTRRNFTKLVISVKDSDPETTYHANVLLTQHCEYPLHLGVTEAGPLIPSLVRSSYILGRLLSEGIGSTLRISITGAVSDEVKAGVELLKMLNLRRAGIRLISCPKCGRASFDTHWFVSAVEPILRSVDSELTVAVMGCAVNGPGEARHADIGITGMGKEVFIFRLGEVVRRVSLETCLDAFKEELDKVIHEKTDH